MSKQLSKNEWLYYFDLYEKDYYKFVHEYTKRRGKWNHNIKSIFVNKYKTFKYNNDDMILESKTGKSPKRGKGSGRPKSSKSVDKAIDELSDELKKEIIKRYIEIINESEKEKDRKIIDKLIKEIKLSSRKISYFVNLSKSHICRIRNGFEMIKRQKTDQQIIIEKLIEEIFYKHKKRYGRKPISIILHKKYKISISYRQVGRIMNNLGLFCHIRKKRKNREIKNTKVYIQNIVERDFDNKNHKQTILATDVTFIPSPKDINQSHVYLSATINHRTKQIVSYKLSKNNDINLIIDSLVDVKQKNCIIHSDHGTVYSSKEFHKFIKKNKWTQSMSRVGNSLDNREIEYWFSLLKTELINTINLKEISYNDLSKFIDDYVNYYNNERIQEKLNWLSPMMYNKRHQNGFVPF